MNHPSNEQILSAAKTSPEAKKALNKLYPDLFKDPVRISRKLIDKIERNNRPFVKAAGQLTNTVSDCFLRVMDYSSSDENSQNKPQYQRGFYLGSYNQWEIVTLNCGLQILKPIKYKDE